MVNFIYGIVERRTMQVLPNIEGFKCKVRIKYQVEKYISTKNNKFENLYKKMAKGSFSTLN